MPDQVEILDVNQDTVLVSGASADNVEVAAESLSVAAQTVDRVLFLESFERGPQGPAGAPGANTAISIATVTGTTYTLTLADAQNAVETTNASPVTVTIPLDSTLNFPVGTQIELVQAGTGALTVAGAVGVTLRSTGLLTTPAQWSRVRLRKRAANDWLVKINQDDNLSGYLKTVNNTGLTLVPSTQIAADYTIVGDGTDSSLWPNRFSMNFQAQGSTSHLTGYFNEYGELRVVPGKNNTVPFRIFGGTTAADYTARAAGINLFEIQTDRNTRTNLFTVDRFGNVSAPNIGNKIVTWPTGSEPSLTGVPDGTLWVEYTP